MKKIALSIFAGLIALTIAGCAANTATTTTSVTSELPITSGAVTESAEAAESAEKEEIAEVTVPAETETVEANAVSADASGSAGSNQPAQTPASTPYKPAATPPATTPPQSETPKLPASTLPPPEPPKTETPPPATPQSTPTPTPIPEPTESPKSKTAYDAPYDTAQIIADARAYGESIGMTWSEPLTVDNCSWEAPGTTSTTLSGDRLKAGIENGIRRVKKLQADNEYQPGEFHFKLLLVPQENGEYTIYWLMG